MHTAGLWSYIAHRLSSVRKRQAPSPLSKSRMNGNRHMLRQHMPHLVHLNVMYYSRPYCVAKRVSDIP